MQTSNNSPLVQVTVGIVAKVSSSLLVKLPICPLFTAACILQSHQADHQLAKQIGDKQLNTITILQQIKQDQGISSWFRGFPVELLKNILTGMFSPMLMKIFNIIPKFDPSTDLGKYYLRNVVGGALIGTAMEALTRPLAYVRFKLAFDTIGKRQYSGPIDVLKKTIETNGYSALFVGLDASLIKLIVYRFSYFVMYDILTSVNPYPNDIRAKFLIAQLISFSNFLICYPLETVERKLQVQADKKEKTFSGTLDCFQKTYKEEGISGFFRGWKISIATSLAISGGFILYDLITN
ncbi:mitochondrial ADP/ATP-transporter [Naegleria gruberi]|uniref:ADP/ATP translocase n=1 Tax=Naegleria gruberi TaxID=5762 RepID=D2W394_NAEGR|nr:mitochondrial ADP/ATP-transporter [Naegleria gruberi]EFC36475.1 mitochondrial ADP/ATP-transporter [Naegleria gruberi]|eukprot:XP_002669219.1 mitochondrial ADP/ATP-transporter [Naegleria gruberi strain NEG-M]